MGQGDSKHPGSHSRKEDNSFVRRESTKVLPTANSTRSVQLTEKEKKKLQHLQQKAEAKRLKHKEAEDIITTEKKDVRSGRERAATKIQAAMRGTIGRKKFIRFKEERERKAAIKIQALIRGFLWRRRYKALKGRTVVAKELHATERDYLGYLSVIIQVYIRPLRGLDENDHPLLTGEEMKLIFSQIEVIYSYNTQFLVSLEYAIGKKWSYYTTIGDIFLTFVEFFRAPYKQFILMYTEAAQAIDICSKRSGVEAFFQKCKKRAESGNRDINSLMSMPFQRIPRYILLLKELLKYTRRDHDDFTYICQALQKMEDLASSANEQIRHLELKNAVLEISKQFEPPIQNLVNPYRKFKRDGELKCRKEHSHEKFYDSIVFLFNDCIVVTIKITGKSAPKFRPKLVVHLKNCVVLDCKDSDGPEAGGDNPLSSSWDAVAPGDGIQLTTSARPPTKQMFEFRVHSLNESVVFRAPSQEVKDIWMANIITEVNLLTESKLTSHPLWRSKAATGISSLRKKTLQKNRTLSQTKFDATTARKDGHARKDSIGVSASTSQIDVIRKDSIARKDSTATKDGATTIETTTTSDPASRKGSTARKESGADQGKHMAELANVLAAKKLAKASASAAPLRQARPSNADEDKDKVPPPSTPKPEEEGLVIKDTVSLVSIAEEPEHIFHPPPVTKPHPAAPITTLPPLSSILKPIALPRRNTKPLDIPAPQEPAAPQEPKEPNVPKESQEPQAPTDTAAVVPIVAEVAPPAEPTKPPTPIPAEIHAKLPTEPQHVSSKPPSATPSPSGSKLRLSLAASLHLELAAGVTTDVDEGLALLSEGLELGLEPEQTPSHSDGSTLYLPPPPEPISEYPEEIPSTPTEDNYPSTPKPSTRNSASGDVEGLKTSRPLLSPLSASGPGSPSAFSPILGPPPEAPHTDELSRPRKGSRALPLALDLNSLFTRGKDSPPSSISSSASSSFVSPRWGDSPQSRGSDRASPVLGHNISRRITMINGRHSSDDLLPSSPPQRSGLTSPSIMSQMRVGRMARMSKYSESPSPSSSSTGLVRSSSSSSNSDSESDSFNWRNSMNSSTNSQVMPLSMPDLPLPRSISADMILYVPHHDANGTTGERAERCDIVDDEVFAIYASRFRTLSFSCIEDLLMYGYEVVQED